MPSTEARTSSARTTLLSSRRRCISGRRCNGSTQYVYVAEHLDASLTARIAEIEASDPERAKALKDDVLFYVRQKHQDLLTQLAVSIQGYLAIDLIRKNNIELIKGVDRATTTTISALRTAVIVAQALANQRLVLNQITALNTTTSNMIESTSKLLASQSVDDQRAGRVFDDWHRQARGSVHEHPSGDGRDRRVQGAGVEVDADDHRHIER